MSHKYSDLDIFYIFTIKEIALILTKEIRLLILKIESKTGWEDMISWSDKKYNDLSDSIFDSTQIRISSATLKRISGKFETADDYESNESTLDAISQYLGYNDWHDFKGPKKKSKTLQYTASIITIIAVVGFGILSMIKNKQIKPDDYSIEIKNNYGVAPYTAIFNYSIPNENDITTEIEFGDYSTQSSSNKKSKAVLNPENNTKSHLYTYPGFFKAITKANDKVVKSFKVHVLTNGWRAIHLTNHKSNCILLDHYPVKNGELYISKKQLDSIVTKKAYDQSWIYYINSDTFSFDCDNIIATARMRTQEKVELETGCRFGKFTLVGDSGTISLRICDEGCSNWAVVDAGYKSVRGSNEDFSDFGCDMTQWQDIKMISKNKQVDYYLQNKLIYSLKYNNTIGNLKVIFFDFSVSGEIDHVKITDLNSSILFEDDFNE